MSAIGQLEAAIVARIGAVLTLPGQTHPKVEVRAWPERAREYKMSHPHGCAMVIYKGSKFAQDQSTAGHLVAFEAEFELGLISRTLREPNAPSGSDAASFTAGPPQGETAPSGGSAVHAVTSVGATSSTGIYDLLETCRIALLGWQPDQAAGAVRLRSEDFDDYVEGTWGYSLRFLVPMMTVAERHCPPGPWAVDGPNSCCTLAPPLSQLTHVQAVDGQAVPVFASQP